MSGKPFVIQMKDRSVNDCLLQPLEVKLDPGSGEAVKLSVIDGTV